MLKFVEKQCLYSRPTLILVTYQKNNTYNSHCSHQSTDSVAFSLTEVWYFSLPKAIVTKASFVPETKKNIYQIVFSYG